MEITTKLEENRKRREIEVEPYKGSVVLSRTIPEVTAQLLYDEFGINLPNPKTTIPIVFTTGWKHILQFVQKQQLDEFAINIGGVSLEYVTEISESDKATNIVPQLYHIKAPIFTKNENNTVPGSNYNDELLNKLNAWRTVNLMETINVVEQEVYKEIFDTFAIDLRVSAIVLPLLAATYSVGLQIARESGESVSMYNVFKITVVEGDEVILTPLAMVKQYIKNDSKKL